MALSLQEISDRFEIQDLIVGYCYAVDDRKYDRLRDYFTPDAVIDYTEMVPFKGNIDETIAFLKADLDKIPMFQHGFFATEYTIDGDNASTRSVCHTPMVLPGDDGKPHTMFVGLWYIQEFRRTEQGWRVSRLYEKKCYQHNIPEYLKASFS